MRPQNALETALEIRPDWDEAAAAKVDYLAREDQISAAEEFVAQYLIDNPDSQLMRVRYSRLLASEQPLYLRKLPLSYSSCEGPLVTQSEQFMGANELSAFPSSLFRNCGKCTRWHNP